MLSKRVTIAIPTYNRAKYLSLAISSALRQTYTNIQVVISNNASSDNTTDVIMSFADSRITVLDQTAPLSMVENWNACLRATNGAYFLLLSDDDVLEPDAIAKLLHVYETYEHSSSIGIVYCRGQFIDSAGQVSSIGQSAPRLELAEELIVGFFQSRRDIWPCSILFRTSDLGRGYNPQFKLGADAVMWMQSVVRRGSAAFVDHILVNYRVHLNTSATTPIDIWQKENAALAMYALELLNDAGRLDRQLKRRVESDVKRLNVRIIPGLIKNAAEGSTKLSLYLLIKNIKYFLSMYGIYMFTKGFLFLLAPPNIIALVRKASQKFNKRSITSKA